MILLHVIFNTASVGGSSRVRRRWASYGPPDSAKSQPPRGNFGKSQELGFSPADNISFATVTLHHNCCSVIETMLDFHLSVFNYFFLYSTSALFFPKLPKTTFIFFFTHSMIIELESSACFTCVEPDQPVELFCKISTSHCWVLGTEDGKTAYSQYV